MKPAIVAVAPGPEADLHPDPDPHAAARAVRRAGPRLHVGFASGPLKRAIARFKSKL